MIHLLLYYHIYIIMYIPSLLPQVRSKSQGPPTFKIERGEDFVNI